ncbi:MAG: putative signal transducing protein [Flavobacteriales bacterium]
MTDDFVTIYICAYANEVMLPRMQLEAEGIACFVKDEYTDPIVSIANGGVKLQVREQDCERAIDILTGAGFLGKEG